MSSRVFIMLVSACRLASSRYNLYAKPRDLANIRATLLAAEWKNVLLVWGSKAEVRSNFYFSQGRFLFWKGVAPTSCQGFLGFSALLNLILFYLFYLSFLRHYTFFVCVCVCLGIYLFLFFFFSLFFCDCFNLFVSFVAFLCGLGFVSTAKYLLYVWTNFFVKLFFLC